MKQTAFAAITAQGIQAAIGFVLQILVLRVLGVADYGRYALLYGIVVVVMAVMSGLVGDSLVVLHREDLRIRAALEGLALFISLAAGIVAMLVVLLLRFADPAEGLAFAVGLVTYTLMEVVRRLLIAHFAYLRAAVADMVGFATSAGVIVVGQVTAGLSLWIVLAATATGQAAACLVGWRLLPSSERFLVAIRQPDYRAVWRYGSWRGLQQMLRPGLFTVARALVAGFAGLAAVGLLEAARTYVSPLMLVVGSLSSLLFVRFANRAKSGGVGSLREADRLVAVLLLLAVVLGAIALVLASWVGPLVFAVQLDYLSVLGWVAYGTTVAMVTPYGALSAVTGHQVMVFGIRLADTVAGVGLAALTLLTGAPFQAVPFGLAVASLLGGVALRWVAARDDGAANRS